MTKSGAQSALLIVDVQNDFCPGGLLAVAQGDRVIPPLNVCVRRFAEKGLPVFLSRDWHPQITAHFKAFGGIWPVHCVMETRGAAFHPALQIPERAIIVSKGMNPKRDDYSAFDGTDGDGTPLADLLRRLQVTRIFIGGLATDYCVKETALAALRHGFAVTILEDAVRGVDLQEGDSQRAMAEMKAAGAQVATTETIDLN
jgi:nicotinamidase/pyrazinamidase